MIIECPANTRLQNYLLDQDMRLFHHKTKHWYFRVFFPAMLVVQIVILAIGAQYYS